ncbi:hypothetical protein JXQ31_10315 [candidate division KSB1 bacterium]|nr:hypothetical protein [candidate division KSB1 bacterium]
MKIKSVLLIIVVAATLVISLLALNLANRAYRLALSDIQIEERNTLMTPVFDQETEQWSFLAIYEIGLTNQGPDRVVLNEIARVTDGMGFLVPLKGSDIVDKSPDYKAFMVEPTLAEIRTNPKLIKTISANDLGESRSLMLGLDSGQTKAIRFGVLVNAYDEAKVPIAQMILLSFRLKFDNGRIKIFRRGFPVTSLTTG